VKSRQHNLLFAAKIIRESAEAEMEKAKAEFNIQLSLSANSRHLVKAYCLFPATPTTKAFVLQELVGDFNLFWYIEKGRMCARFCRFILKQILKGIKYIH
jgi:serine/threonine protein kinase